MADLMMESMKYLANVPSQNYFHLSNGKIAENLEGLYDVIIASDDSVFYNHVTSDRNDFANWIKYCILDEELYAKLIDIKQKEVFLGVLAEEIALLKNNALGKFKEPQQSNISLRPQTLESVQKQANQSLTKPDSSNKPQDQSSARTQSDAQILVSPPAQSAVPVESASNVQNAPVIETDDVVQSAPITMTATSPVVQTTSPVQSASPVQSNTQVQTPVQPESPPQESSQAQNTQAALGTVSVELKNAPLSEPDKAQIVGQSIQQQVSSIANNDNALVNSVIEEVMEFEQILRSIIDEVEKDIVSWDT